VRKVSAIINHYRRVKTKGLNRDSNNCNINKNNKNSNKKFMKITNKIQR
jgi:hypothetical protein